jgi:ABC-type transport system substrate-binding protein
MRGGSRLRVIGVVSILAVLTVVAASCSSSTNSGGGSAGATSTTVNPATQLGEHDILPPQATGSPVYGGTLKIVGSGDVDHLDTCCAYYTTTYELLRAVSRQLVSYPSTYANPAPTQPVPDIATWTLSSNNLTYTFSIKKGVMWDEPSGPVQVTSYDEELGLKRLCNPVLPAPPLDYWEDNIAGMQTFCNGFAAIKLPTSSSGQVAAIKNYIENNQISGISTPNSSTIAITLEHPASSFINIMALPMSSPVPQTILQWVPGSIQEEQHFISDGPYTITEYTPNVSYMLTKNPYWQQSTDTLRHQYVDNISVSMGNNPTTIQQELETGSADLEWDTTVPSASVSQLSTSPDFVAGYIGGITYLVFNMKSTADGGALAKPAVREALQYCVNKRHIVQVSGGPLINVASNQILPPQITGYKEINPYASTQSEGDPAKCKSMLAAAGYPNGLNLKLVYANNPPMPAQATALQADMQMGGVNLSLNEQPSQGEYFDYIETPSNKANWDLAFGLWFPDWDGNGAQSIFSPLLDGTLYTNGSTDYGDYNDPTVNTDIANALKAPTISAAATDWSNLDSYVMTQDPAWIPLIYQALPQFVGTNVEGATYNGFLGYVDITNLWLKNG